MATSSAPSTTSTSSTIFFRTSPAAATDIELEGPAVAEVQKLFLETWRKQGGPTLDDTGFFPVIPTRGNEIVRIIGSTPDDPLPRYYATLLSAIGSADSRLWLTTAYFVPTDEEVKGLIKAARRGVDVRLLLPGQSDSALALARGHFHYENPLNAGVKISNCMTRSCTRRPSLRTISGSPRLSIARPGKIVRLGKDRGRRHALLGRPPLRDGALDRICGRCGWNRTSMGALSGPCSATELRSRKIGAAGTDDPLGGEVVGSSSRVQFYAPVQVSRQVACGMRRGNARPFS